MTGRRDPKGPDYVNLPDDFLGRIPTPKPKPCCAKCRTPYGHSALAGTCCHTTTKEQN